MSWVQPRSALFWVYLFVIIVGALALIVQMLPIAILTWSGVAVGLPFTLVTLLVIGWILLALDRFRAHVRIMTPLAMGFVWGAAAGPGLAMFANDENMRVIQNLAGDAFAVNWQDPISAAIVEEGLKGVGVFAVAMLARPLLYRPMHGLLLGGFTGLGFQVVENLTYSANAGLTSAQGDIGSALIVGILRLITGLVSHWMMTGVAGVGIVVAVGATQWSPARRLGIFLGCYLVGAALHFAWDAPQPETAGAGDIIRRMIIATVVFAIVYAAVLRSEKRWFRTVVGRAESQGTAPPGELETLISNRARRRYRRTRPGSSAEARERQRELLDWVQTVGALR